MKYSTFLIAFILITLWINAKAQTKEETIDWISSKIEKGGVFSTGRTSDSISCNDRYIIVTYHTGSVTDYEHMDCTGTVKIPFSAIVRINANIYDGRYHGSRFTLYTADKDITTTYENCNDNYTPRSTSYYDLGVNYDFEEHFMDRLVKAFNKLISYNTANMPHEAFK